MNPLSFKLQSILRKMKQARKHEAAKAPKCDAERKLFVIAADREIQVIATEVKAARARLEDVHTRLTLTLRSGQGSDSIH